jgi:riboflavin synthase
MFTGIIEEIGKVRELTSQGMWIDVTFSKELKLGQSVACDGVCLTVVEMDESGFRVDLLEETRRMTAFSELESGSLINVERAMKADSRFDGHVVQAHSEGVGTLKKARKERNDRKDSKEDVETFILTVEVPNYLMKYMILKGIVILNGIALTITSLDDEKWELEVAIIPHTWENTNLHALKPGAKVNVETDVLAKYVERLIHRT